MIKTNKIPLVNPKKRKSYNVMMKKSINTQISIQKRNKLTRKKALWLKLLILDILNAVGGITSMGLIIIEASKYVRQNEYKKIIIVKDSPISASFLVPRILI